MGTFHVGCLLQNHLDRSKQVQIPKLLVDTGSEYTWISKEILDQIGVQPEHKLQHFQMADGRVISRHVGFAIIRIGKTFTVDEVIFANRNDMQLLGSRTMEGMNLVVLTTQKKLVPGGPVFAAQMRRL